MESSTVINIKDYSYSLPEKRIAKRPLDNRDQSKLLLYRKGKLTHTQFKEIGHYIPANNLLIRNNTRVIQARIKFTKDTGASIEIFCLEPIKPKSYELNFSAKGRVDWKCMVGNAKKWKSGILFKLINKGEQSIELKASLLEKNITDSLIRFEWNKHDISFAEILEIAGTTPIPPYLNRKAEQEDKNWYQTVYAQLNGSVAAPTAGLHFTQEVFNTLKTKNIDIEEVTLHVGAGTFRPVQTENIMDHKMHVEALVVGKPCLLKLLERLDSGITAVGTTSLRTLESIYWLGRKIFLDPNIEPSKMDISQWEPYTSDKVVSVENSLKSILGYLNYNSLDEIKFSTSLIIMPGYKFYIVDRLITNFHQPGSTLLLLVAAFIGNDWKSVYQYALDNDFRFLSYGDSSILERVPE